MIVEFKDYLKTLSVATHYSIGKIDNSKDFSLGVYADGSTRRVEAFGLDSNYGTFGFKILLHWNKNARETEEAAFNLFEKIRYIQNTDMTHTEDTGDSSGVDVTTTVHVQYIELDYDEPISIGTDENGVYEYVITGTIYYRK